MLKGGSRSPKYSAYMEVNRGRCKRYASGSAAATAQRRAGHRARLQDHAAGFGPLGEAGIPGGRTRSGGRTAPQETREAERESARACRRGLGASEARRARSARALDGPPDEFSQLTEQVELGPPDEPRRCAAHA